MTRNIIGKTILGLGALVLASGVFTPNAFSANVSPCATPLPTDEVIRQGMMMFHVKVRYENKKQYKTMSKPDNPPRMAQFFPFYLYEGTFEEFEAKRVEYLCHADQLIREAKEKQEKDTAEANLPRKWDIYLTFKNYYPAVSEGLFTRFNPITFNTVLQLYGISKEEFANRMLPRLTEIQDYDAKNRFSIRCDDSTRTNFGSSDCRAEALAAIVKQFLKGNSQADALVEPYKSVMRSLESGRLDRKGYESWKLKEEGISIPPSKRKELLQRFQEAQEYARMPGNHSGAIECGWVKGDYLVLDGSPLCTPEGSPLPQDQDERAEMLNPIESKDLGK